MKTRGFEYATKRGLTDCPGNGSDSDGCCYAITGLNIHNIGIDGQKKGTIRGIP